MLRIILLLVVVLLSGCAGRFRSHGEAYSGYSCRESIIHFYSRCSSENLTKELFESKISDCEKDLAAGVCDKQLADSLWCMGRVEAGLATAGPLFTIPADGCDCSSFWGALKQCRMENGIFEPTGYGR